MPIKTFFPLIIDNTMMATFDACPMDAFRKHIQHLSRGYESTDLIAGAAIAKGFEVARKAYYNDSLDHQVAIELGQEAVYESYGDHIPFGDSVKTADKMASALEMYFWEYPMMSDNAQPAKLKAGGYAIEHHFSVELPIPHPVYGIPLHYFGRADMLGIYGGKLFVVDEKTTGSYFTKNWAESWNTRGQFTAYAWALQHQGIKVEGALVRGISLQKTSTKFQETTTIRNQFMIDNWSAQFLKKLQRWVDAYKGFLESDQKNPAMFFDGAWNEACDKYFRPCQWKSLCTIKSEENYLADNFGQRIWLPHMQKDMELGEYLETLPEHTTAEITKE